MSKQTVERRHEISFSNYPILTTNIKGLTTNESVLTTPAEWYTTKTTIHEYAFIGQPAV